MKINHIVIQSSKKNHIVIHFVINDKILKIQHPSRIVVLSRLRMLITLLYIGKLMVIFSIKYKIRNENYKFNRNTGKNKNL